MRVRRYKLADVGLHPFGKDLSMKLLVTLEQDETGMVVAECPSIPGCVSQGATEAEALENIREAIASLLGSA